MVADAPAAEEQEQGDKAAKKQGKKGAAAGPVLGKGTAIARAVLEAAAAGVQAGEDGSAAANGSGHQAASPALPLAESGGALADGFDAGLAVARLQGALDPRSPSLARLLDELRSVVEANQVWGASNVQSARTPCL